MTLQTVACPASLSTGFSRPRILEWVAMTSFRGSSQPRGRTHVSYVSSLADRFFTTSTMWEAPHTSSVLVIYPRKVKTFLHKNSLYKNDISNFIHKQLKSLKNTHIHQQMIMINKFWYIHTISSNRKEWTDNTLNSTNELFRKKKPDSKAYLLYDFTYLTL